MSEAEPRDRMTVRDLAREAGVSLATVDRVLNARPGVSPATMSKVEAAIERTGFRRDLTASMLARARHINVRFLLPGGTNHFMTNLADAVHEARVAEGAERLKIELQRVPPMDPQALARELDLLEAQSCDCAVIVVMDETTVRDAVARAAARGVRVVTLVSDLPGSERAAFVGIDNRAAGRTAGRLLGHFCQDGHKVALLAGSLDLLDHAERISGFREIVDTAFSGLKIVGPAEGRDDRNLTRQATLALFGQHPDIAGLYNAGAGNAGLIAALEELGVAGRVRVVTHELTEPTRSALLSGSVDVVLDQSPREEIRSACRAVRRLVLGPDVAAPAKPIEFRIYLRDNLQQAEPD